VGQWFVGCQWCREAGPEQQEANTIQHAAHFGYPVFKATIIAGGPSFRTDIMAHCRDAADAVAA
jgi:hypothetical protein